MQVVGQIGCQARVAGRQKKLRDALISTLAYTCSTMLIEAQLLLVSIAFLKAAVPMKMANHRKAENIEQASKGS